MATIKLVSRVQHHTDCLYEVGDGGQLSMVSGAKVSGLLKLLPQGEIPAAIPGFEISEGARKWLARERVWQQAEAAKAAEAAARRAQGGRGNSDDPAQGPNWAAALAGAHGVR